jgi:membrane associated rhomboid family serine protease
MNLWTDIFKKLLIPLLLTLLIALGYEFTLRTGIDSAVFGIHPLDFNRLYGIVTVPLVHGNLSHLLNNLLAFVLLSSLLYVVYTPFAGRVMLALWLITGSLMFLFARPSFYHIGASGVVYALIFYLIAAGFINRSKTPVVISLLVVFYYGGSVWGIFPLDSRVSWDGHLAGAVSGLMMAWMTRRGIARLFPKFSIPDWQDKETESEQNDPYNRFDDR